MYNLAQVRKREFHRKICIERNDEANEIMLEIGLGRERNELKTIIVNS